MSAAGTPPSSAASAPAPGSAPRSSPASSPASPARVVMMGMMATGKTTVGQLLARRLGCDYVDNDTLVLRATGHMLEDLLARSGEAGLRDAETKAMATALTSPAPVVCGIAAGVVLDPANRARLRGEEAHVVWVTVSVEDFLERVASGPKRPWISDDPRGWYVKTLAEREPLYREVADQVVDTSDTSPEECAERIYQALQAG